MYYIVKVNMKGLKTFAGFVFVPGSFIRSGKPLADIVAYDLGLDLHPRLTDIGFYSVACVGEVARLYTYLKMAATTYNALS